ncbi:DUF6308 family protein [Rhodococcus opacus]|uniref:DUF6308 family protein n=1 Tax=Rhodococcus opacus TaxID=37919 RepID=UPI00046CAA57|nr:DUF6308 family protein [Rhodococcus opacus]
MFLSVQVPPTAARAILDTEAEALNALLRAIGPDRDLVSSNRTRWVTTLGESAQTCSVNVPTCER